MSISIPDLNRDALSALQVERIRHQLERVYDLVPHYRRLFDAHGIHPSDFKHLEDLQRFPFTTKNDLRQNYPFDMLAVDRRDLVRVHASSGTTGKPTVVGYTKKDIDIWSDIMARSIAAAGGRPGDLVHVAFGYGLFTGGLGFHYGAERLGCTVVPVSGGQTARQVQLIDDFKPDIIAVTPSYLAVIADEFERQGLDPRDSSIRLGLHGAEPWTDEMRGKIEQRFDMSAIDLYGLSEILGPGVACEFAEAKDGAHIWEDHFYPEIIDPDTGAVRADGEPGELVFTSLTRDAFPMIRYRTRDLTTLLPGSACSMRRMQRISGRSDDMLIIRGVNLFPGQIEALIMEDESLAPHYQLEVSRTGHMDDLRVRVELKKGTQVHSGDKCRVELAHRIKTMIGVSASVDIEPEGGIARSEGKAVRVIDLR